MKTITLSSAAKTNIIFYILLPLLLFMFCVVLDSSESIIKQRISVIQRKLHLFEQRYQNKQSEVGQILQFVDPRIAQSKVFSHTLSKNTQKRLNYVQSVDINFPTVYTFLHHRISDYKSLQPAYLRSEVNRNVSIVIGFPINKNDNMKDMNKSLNNLIENIDAKDLKDTLIVVCICEPNIIDVNKIAKIINNEFFEHVQSGIINIISPSSAYYPTMSKLGLSIGENLNIIKSRKENLDFAFLMAYAHFKGVYYLQLENNINASRGFISIIKQAIAMQRQPWFIMDFGQDNFGKLLRCSDLPQLISFIHMFYTEKPLTWLMHFNAELKACGKTKRRTHCVREDTIEALFWKVNPSSDYHLS